MSSPPALFTKHRGIALGIAADYYFPGAEREDVRQEALVALWEAARTYDAEKGPFPAWARGVVHRHLIDCVRVATAGRAMALTYAAREFDAPLTSSLEEAVETRELMRALVLALLELPANQREAIVAVCLEGRSYEEVGRAKAVDNLLWKGRQRLRSRVRPMTAL